jgi:hypothetical protein
LKPGTLTKEPQKNGWGFLILPLIFFGLFMLSPVVRLIIMTFQEIDAATETNIFIGFKNFKIIFKNTQTFRLFIRTFFLALAPDKLAIVVFIPLGLSYLIKRIQPKKQIVLKSAYMSLLLGGSAWIMTLSIIPYAMEPLYFSDRQIPFYLFYHLVDVAAALSIGVPISLTFFQSIRLGPKEISTDYIKPLGYEKLGHRTGIILLLTATIAFSLQASAIPLIFNSSISDTFLSQGFTTSFLNNNFGRGSVYYLFLLVPVILCGVGAQRIIQRKQIVLWIRSEWKGLKKEERNNRNAAVGWLLFFVLALIPVVFIYIAFQSFFDPRLRAGVPRFPIEGLGKSVLVSFGWFILTLLVQIGVSFSGGYAFGYFKENKVKKIINNVLLIFIFVTPALILNPLFIFFKDLNIVNSLLPMLLCWLGMPFGIVLFQLYFKGERINKERIEHKELRRNRIKICIFITAVLSLVHVNAIAISLYFGYSTTHQSLHAFLYRLIYSVNKLVPSDFIAYSILIFIPILMVLLTIFVVLNIYLFPRISILKRDEAK